MVSASKASQSPRRRSAVAMTGNGVNTEGKGKTSFFLLLLRWQCTAGSTRLLSVVVLERGSSRWTSDETPLHDRVEEEKEKDGSFLLVTFFSSCVSSCKRSVSKVSSTSSSHTQGCKATVVPSTNSEIHRSEKEGTVLLVVEEYCGSTRSSCGGDDDFSSSSSGIRCASFGFAAFLSLSFRSCSSE